MGGEIDVILQNFLSPNIEIRNFAKTWLETADNKTVLLSLLDAIESQPAAALNVAIKAEAGAALPAAAALTKTAQKDRNLPSDVSNIAAVLLRSKLTAIWKSPNAAGSEETLRDMQVFVKNEVGLRVLKQLVMMEPSNNKQTRNRLSAVVAVISEFCYRSEVWPELWMMIDDLLRIKDSAAVLSTSTSTTAAAAQHHHQQQEEENDSTVIRISSSSSNLVSGLTLLNYLAEFPSNLKVIEKHIGSIKPAIAGALLARPAAGSSFEENRIALELIASLSEGIAAANVGSCVISKALKHKSGVSLQLQLLKRVLRSITPQILATLETAIEIYIHNQQQQQQQQQQQLQYHNNDDYNNDHDRYNSSSSDSLLNSSAAEHIHSLLLSLNNIGDADRLFWFKSIQPFLEILSRVVFLFKSHFHLREVALLSLQRAASGVLRKASTTVLPTVSSTVSAAPFTDGSSSSSSLSSSTSLLSSSSTATPAAAAAVGLLSEHSDDDHSGYHNDKVAEDFLLYQKLEEQISICMCNIIAALVESEEGFAEPNERWMKRSDSDDKHHQKVVGGGDGGNDNPAAAAVAAAADYDDDDDDGEATQDFLETVAASLGQLIKDSDSPTLDQHLFKLSVNLLSVNRPASIIMGLRILNELINESRSILDKEYESIHSRIIAFLKHPTDINNIENEFLNMFRVEMQCRWWMVTILGNLYNSGSYSVLSMNPHQAIGCLVMLIQTDPVMRCKCRSIWALYMLLVAINIDQESTNFLDKATVENLVKNIVVVAIKSSNEELQEYGIAIASVLASAAKESFKEYYRDFMVVSCRVLSDMRDQLKQSSISFNLSKFKRNVKLFEPSVDLLSKLVTSFESERSIDELFNISSSLIDIAYEITKHIDHDDAGGVSLEQQQQQPHEQQQRKALSAAAQLMSIEFVFEGISVFASILNNRFSPFMAKLFESFNSVFSQSDAVRIGVVDGREVSLSAKSDSLAEDASACLNAHQLQKFTYNAIRRVMSGQAEYKADTGITQLHIPGRDGEDQFIELKTKIIEQKTATLKVLAELVFSIDCCSWISYIPQILRFIKSATTNNFDALREAALDAAFCLVSSLLSINEEENKQEFQQQENQKQEQENQKQQQQKNPKAQEQQENQKQQDQQENQKKQQEQQCALVAGVITIVDFFHVEVDLITHLLYLANKPTRTEKIAAFIKTVSRLTKTLNKASCICPSFVHQLEFHNKTIEFLRVVFPELGKCMIVVLQQDILNSSNNEAAAAAAVDDDDDDDDEINRQAKKEEILAFDDSKDDSSLSDCCTTDEEDCDFEGVIYTGIFRSVRNLIKIFNPKECTDLFMVHLNIPFSGLLTLPEANLAGRAAALSAFGTILQYGDEATGRRIASEFISVVLLYAKCNTLPEDLKRKIAAGLLVDNEDAYVVEVKRLEAAVCCLAVIVEKFPQVILENFELTVTTLKQIINHPQAKIGRRLRAGQDAVGCLFKIYLKSEFRKHLELAAAFCFDDLFIDHLISWLPFTSNSDDYDDADECDEDDEDEYGSMSTEEILKSVCESHIQKLIEHPRIQQMVNSCSSSSSAN